MRERCYLAAYGRLERGQPMTPCHGRLIKAHLLPAQLIRRAGGDPKDPRAVVPACGGIMGNAGHHGAMDSVRTLKLAREAIPAAVEELAAELGLTYWLDREYGERR